MSDFKFDDEFISFREFTKVYESIESIESKQYGWDSKEKKLKSIQQELDKDSSNLRYLLFHFHHPAFKEEARRYFLFPSRALLNDLNHKISQYSDEKINLSELDTRKFYHFVHSVYFKILGRLDSISEQIYRKYSANDYNLESFFRLEIKEEQVSQIDYEINEGTSDRKALFSLFLSNNFFNKLRGGTSSSSLLGKIFYETLLKEFIKNGKSDSNLHLEYLVKNIETELQKRDFFNFKKSILYECVRCIYWDDQYSKIFYLLNKRFLVSDNPFKKTDTFQFRSRILGIFQALSIYSELFGSNFKLFTVGKGSGSETKLVSGFAFGYQVDVLKYEGYKSSLTSIVNNIISKADEYYEGDEFTEEVSKIYKLIKTDNSYYRSISPYYSDKEIYYSTLFFQNLIELLNDSSHEGVPLRFNILLGQEAYLREVMKPIGSPYEKDKLWEVSYDELKNESKAVQGIAFKILSIYSFLQNTSNFLCFSFGRKAIEVRYIGELNLIYKNIVRVDHTNPLTVFPSIINIAKSNKKLFYGFVDSYESYLALGGRIIGRYSYKKDWIRYAGENWIGKSLIKNFRPKDLPSLFNINKKNLNASIFEKILKAVSTLSYTGYGTMVITGKSDALIKYTTWSQHDFYGQGIMLDQLGKHIEMDEFFLYNMLIRDGGIIIDDNLRVYTRVLINPYEVNESDPAKSKPFNPKTSITDNGMTYAESWNNANEYEWKDFAKWFKWGTRHINAASLSYLTSGECKILTLSSDSEVHFFDGKKIHELKREDERIL